jgi:hypothetical protein
MSIILIKYLDNKDKRRLAFISTNDNTTFKKLLSTTVVSTKKWLTPMEMFNLKSKEVMKEIMRSKESAREFIYSLGMHTKTGRLKKEYGGPGSRKKKIKKMTDSERQETYYQKSRYKGTIG